MNIRSRLNRLEKTMPRNNDAMRGIVGRFYDELTEAEKDAYWAYYGSDRESMEALHGYFMDSLHFRVEKKPKPPTPQEHRATVREVEEIVQGFVDKYNSPEEREKREAAYQDLQRIGRQRKAACGANL